jgi:hypothetical protein
MEIVIKLNTSKESKATSSHPHWGQISIAVRSDHSIAEVLAEVRRQLPPFINGVLERSEKAGSVVFLSKHPNGPNRLSRTKSLSDYQLTDGCTLYLMCAHIVEPVTDE